MKNILLSIIIVSVSLIFVSCSENGLNDSDDMNGTTEIMSSYGGGGFLVIHLVIMKLGMVFIRILVIHLHLIV